MLSDVDIYRAAHLMMHEYGNNAEREAARCADRMLGRGDRESRQRPIFVDFERIARANRPPPRA